MSTACVIVIGNEILSGKFPDENTPFLVRRLRELGIQLVRAVVIPDLLDEIVREVRAARRRADIVITTGGVGPTHDDITMQGIAAAFGVPLVEHPELLRLVEARVKPMNEAARRMSLVPRGSRILADKAIWFPLIVKDEVYILPGVPSLMRRKFEAAARGWSASPLYTGRVVTGERETAIAARLERAVSRWPQLEIGSYPRYDDGPMHVIVTAEGSDEAAVGACVAWLGEQLQPFDLGAVE